MNKEPKTKSVCYIDRLFLAIYFLQLGAFIRLIALVALRLSSYEMDPSNQVRILDVLAFQFGENIHGKKHEPLYIHPT